MECKMYEEMTDEEDDVCAICLEGLDEKDSVCTLAEKFACQCKNRVHEVCLSEWVMRTMGEGNESSVKCIVCRSEVGVWNVGEGLGNTSRVINVGGLSREERARVVLEAYYERRERLLAKRMRVAGILCVLMVIGALLLSLAGVIE